jgi:hypothetical protein
VTATLGRFSDRWLDRLLAIGGDVEFVLVYPPDTEIRSVPDARARSLVSPVKGEFMQRLTGLYNMRGQYAIALDDDDFLHPDIAALASQYFTRCPQSWLLRLRQNNIDCEDLDAIDAPWTEMEWDEEAIAQEFAAIPIAPLEIPFDWRYVFLPWRERTDKNGRHVENFNNKVWNAQIVRESLPEISRSLQLVGNVRWIPAWNLDRYLGLALQAKHFQSQLIIGHAPPTGVEQVRYIVAPSSGKKARFHVSADLLLAKRFPQYGYFWNLLFKMLYDTLIVMKKQLKLSQPSVATQQSRAGSLK